MPRNSQGLYTLPLPPVRAGELVESDWANATLDDLAQAMTGSLPRNGSAPMVGPLTLSADPITGARQATSKEYVDQFMAYASGMFVGSMTYAPITIEPPGWLLCDGRAVSRTTYATLFAAIGTMFGAGDGSTTFNLPPQSQRYLRGAAGGEQIGQLLDGSFAAHAHPLSDPGHVHGASQAVHDHSIVTGPHNHTASQGAHSHSVSHSHGINDPSHSHMMSEKIGAAGGGGDGLQVATTQTTDTGRVTAAGNQTGITIQNATPQSDLQQPAVYIDTTGNLGGYTDARQPTVTVNVAQTGAAVGATGGSENRPASIVCNLFIKASEDSSGPAVLTGITTSDAAMISVNDANPVSPELVIHSNVAFGTVKLDQNAKLPLVQLPAGIQTFLGTFDASGGQNPSEKYPSTTFSDGMTYLVSAAGTITVFNPNTNTQSATAVELGWNLIYLNNQQQPVGWYYVESAVVTAAIASQVAFTPEGTISATNVQDAIAELDAETQASLATKAAVGNTAPPMDGAASAGAATTAARSDHVHPTDTSRAPASAATAAGTSFTPGGSISAATVQGAINELDSEKLALAGGTLTGQLNSTSFIHSRATPTQPYGIATYNSLGGALSGVAYDANNDAGLFLRQATDTTDAWMTAALDQGAGFLKMRSPSTPEFFTLNASISGVTNDFCIRSGDGTYSYKLGPAGAGWTTLSTRESKQNIRPVESSLAKILAIEPVRFSYKISPDIESVGFVAEDICQVDPILASYDLDGTPSAVGKDNIVPFLVRAVQELSHKLDSALAEIAALKAR